MKFLIIIFSLVLVSIRFYLIYKVLSWLIINFENPNPDFYKISWVLCAIFLDHYVSSMEKSYEVNIYKEKSDEK